MRKPIHQLLFQTSQNEQKYRWSFPNLFPLILLTVSTIIIYAITLGTESSYEKIKHTFDQYGLKVYEDKTDYLSHSYEVFTSVFLHISIAHLAFNLVMLISMWLIATYRIYRAKTLIFTMIVAAITTSFSYQFLGNPELIAVGLSGLTYSLLGLTIGGLIIHKPYAKKSAGSTIAFWYTIIFSVGFLIDSISSIWQNAKAHKPFLENLRAMTDASVTHVVGALTGLLIAFILVGVQIKLNKNAPIKNAN